MGKSINLNLDIKRCKTLMMECWEDGSREQAIIDMHYSGMAPSTIDALNHYSEGTAHDVIVESWKYLHGLKENGEQ